MKVSPGFKMALVTAAGVRLHVGVFGVEQGAEAVDSQLLDLVHYLAAAVVALPGITFCILVGANGSHGLQHLLRYVVFGCNQFQASALAFLFFLDKVKNLNVFFHKYLNSFYSLQR